MLTKILKTTTGKLTVSIPEHLNEITLGQLIDLQSKDDMTDLDAIHILSGIPLEQLKNIKNFADLAIFNTHIINLADAIKQAYNSDSLPKYITLKVGGKEKKIPVIKNLSIEPAGAFLAAREVITEEINKHISTNGEENWQETFNPSLNVCAAVLAHYFYVPATGKPYDEYHAEKFTEGIKQLPFTDALPIAKYFFLNYPDLSKRRISFWHRAQLLWKRRLALSSFTNSGMLTRLTPWPAAT